MSTAQKFAMREKARRKREENKDDNSWLLEPDIESLKKRVEELEALYRKIRPSSAGKAYSPLYIRNTKDKLEAARKQLRDLQARKQFEAEEAALLKRIEALKSELARIGKVHHPSKIQEVRNQLEAAKKQLRILRLRGAIAGRTRSSRKFKF